MRVRQRHRLEHGHDAERALLFLLPQHVVGALRSSAFLGIRLRILRCRRLRSAGDLTCRCIRQSSIRRDFLRTGLCQCEGQSAGCSDGCEHTPGAQNVHVDGTPCWDLLEGTISPWQSAVPSHQKGNRLFYPVYSLCNRLVFLEETPGDIGPELDEFRADGALCSDGEGAVQRLFHTAVLRGIVGI